MEGQQDQSSVLVKSESNSHVAKEYYRQMQEGKYTDFKIGCAGGNFFRCHRMVLVANSDYFKRLVDEKNASSLFLPGTPARLVEALLKFMYTGETKVAAKDMEDFDILAASLEIKQIKASLCGDRITSAPAAAIKTNNGLNALLEAAKIMGDVSDDAAERNILPATVSSPAEGGSETRTLSVDSGYGSLSPN